MSKLDESFDKAMKAAKKIDDESRLPSVVHGLPANGEYVGTCQACFGQYVVKQFKSFESRAGSGDGWVNLKPMPKGKLVVVLHGYERPGYGYTQGECPGRGHEPFEVAKDVTELFRKRKIQQIADGQKRLAKMKRGEVTSLYIEIQDKTQQRDRRTWKYPTKTIEIKPGWVNDDKEYSYQTDNFETRLKAAISKLEGEVDYDESVLKFLDKKLASWKYDPQALTQTTGRKIGVRAEDQAAAEAESRARSAERNSARDLKEKKARDTLAAYLASPEALNFIKTNQTEIVDKERGWGFKPSGESFFDFAHRRYIGPAEKETNQVRRIELLKSAYSVFADAIRRHNYSASKPIKVKLPRGK